ncbi:MAG: hypothetical protein HHAS10_09090 [Candidatus Altimarinota bacterium]
MDRVFLIGVDEAGRGAWAGPVCAGAFCVPIDFDFSLLVGLTDSKKLSPIIRERLFGDIEKLSREGKCRYAFGESDAQCIDEVGIREANRRAMKNALIQVLQNMESDSKYSILIDGRDNYKFEGISMNLVKYIIHGDLIEPVISAASIIAKVGRDRIMCDFSKDCPEYQFSLHKGYGTKKHQDALLYYGIHPLHRKSYAPVKALISEKA